jgi:hypothetical protein
MNYSPVKSWSGHRCLRNDEEEDNGTRGCERIRAEHGLVVVVRGRLSLSQSQVVQNSTHLISLRPSGECLVGRRWAGEPWCTGRLFSVEFVSAMTP